MGSVTQRTRQPILPLNIPGAVSLQAFLVGANGAAPTQVPSGEITGSGPNFTWNASSRLGQTLRYEYTALDGTGQVVGRGRGQLVVDTSGAITHTPDAPVRTPALLRLAALRGRLVEPGRDGAKAHRHGKNGGSRRRGNSWGHLHAPLSDPPGFL